MATSAKSTNSGIKSSALTLFKKERSESLRSLPATPSLKFLFVHHRHTKLMVRNMLSIIIPLCVFVAGKGGLGKINLILLVFNLITILQSWLNSASPRLVDL